MASNSESSTQSLPLVPSLSSLLSLTSAPSLSSNSEINFIVESIKVLNDNQQKIKGDIAQLHEKNKIAMQSLDKIKSKLTALYMELSKVDGNYTKLKKHVKNVSSIIDEQQKIDETDDEKKLANFCSKFNVLIDEVNKSKKQIQDITNNQNVTYMEIKDNIRDDITKLYQRIDELDCVKYQKMTQKMNVLIVEVNKLKNKKTSHNHKSQSQIINRK